MPGERSQKREALRGALTLIALSLVFVLIFFAADVRRLFTPMATLHVVMPSAAGLQKGAAVLLAGQTVGEIESIEVRPPNADTLDRVVLSVRVERRHLEHIREDSEARITSLRMVGDPVIDILPGTATQPALQPGDTLRTRTAATPASAMKRAVSLQESLQGLIAESRTLGTQARDRAAQAKRLNARLATTSRELRAFTAAVRGGPLNTLSDPEFKRIVGSLGDMIGELRSTFMQAADRARAARGDAEPALRRLAARADTISAQISQLQNAIAQSGGGLLVRAQTDSAIVKALHEAQVQMDSLIAETKRNPLRFWF
jgi:ABC-type transporter Mla subunit MlaD